MGPRILQSIMALAAMFTPLLAHGQWDPIKDGSFEMSMSQPFPPLPAATGFWGGDEAAFVEATLGVAPRDGERMLQFVSTTPSGATINDIGSGVVQLLEITGDLSSVQTGISASAYFNSVAGDSNTDRKFILRIEAWNTDPATYPNGSALIAGGGYVFVDDDPTTWELVTGETCLPEDTTFIAVQVSAVEDVFNDSVAPEFDGHFCDLVVCQSFTMDVEFRRGDCNLDEVISLADVLFQIKVLLGGLDAGCMDSCDWEDNGEIGIHDVFATFNYLFLGSGVPPAPPFPNCGRDTTPDDWCCEMPSCP